MQDKIDEFMEEGFSFREAEEQALKWIKDKVALHDPSNCGWKSIKNNWHG